ncbi:Tubulin polyglutamylase TTLL5 [Hondaea fermentalgiana]|uniref:Tubulin polyglutamylase TTLL5 n=1 Tax=Hondaea fermentalgiana TaxID=2315210 RepID=A0A2R5GJ46_9STRA|nr:Tubulin polyglutamylase TTLL5 [Hondaea fermentalgiana]|eukprot:GBG30339.1 Tubulin polyglutamylase TTLL5 [Hondaea fermentalgiana]
MSSPTEAPEPPLSAPRSERWTYFCPRHESSWLAEVIAADERFSPAPAGTRADFAWVHTLNETELAVFRSARVRGGNGVSGVEVLEDKFKFALLTQRDQCKDANLESYACESIAQLARVCAAVFADKNGKAEAGTWIVKDARANCGDGLFVVMSHNWRDVIASLTSELQTATAGRVPPSFVLQKYIEEPELWNGKFKYHCRLFLVLRADGAAFLHSHALAHVANKPYTLEPDHVADPQVHLSNVSKNHSDADLFHGCPIIALEEFFGSNRLEAVCTLFANVFMAARPFMEHQQAASDFCLIGADLMFETSGAPRLLECNVPPGIGNYDSHVPADQYAFTNALFSTLLDTFVLPALSGQTQSPSAPSGTETSKGQSWLQVCEPRSAFLPQDAERRGFNALSWKVYQRRALKGPGNRPAQPQQNQEQQQPSAA